MDSSNSFPVFPLIFGLGIMVFFIYCMWKIFEKAGHEGWKCLIPIYNAYIQLKIAQMPGWYLLLLLIPFVNIVIAIMMSIKIAENFGKSSGFGLGLAFLGFIFYPILALGDAQYLPLLSNNDPSEHLIEK